jgi:VCBS repeat-containing protein
VTISDNASIGGCNSQEEILAQDDSDGIEQDVDAEPLMFSNDFSDVSLGGTTSGSIIDRGDQVLTIRDAPQPYGILASTDAAGGEGKAVVTACGSHGTAQLDADEEVTFTCGSVAVKVVRGVVELEFDADDGRGAVVGLNEGNGLTFEPETNAFTADPENVEDVIIVVEGMEFPLEPGETWLVNIPPVAEGDAYAVDEDTELVLAAPGVLANDTDADGDVLTAVLSQGPAKGTLTLNSDGSFTYHPATNWHGTDQFAYRAKDGNHDSNVATVTITVNAVNDAPLATADQASVTADEGQTTSNTGAVSDVDGDAVTLTANVGAVVNNGDGTWSWSYPTVDGPAESQTVTISANDGNGGVAHATFGLTVYNVAPTVSAVATPATPVPITDAVSASAVFSDPAGAADEAYTCLVNYGDETGPRKGTVSGMTCAGPGHTYAEPGVHTVTASVTDKDGDSGSGTAEALVVVYDASGGFVTGGGWIASQWGAYKPDPSLAGKATFGFVAKYKKGATEPTGGTEFQFRTARLNFHSSRYEWLVVNQGGGNAQFRGFGSVNGEDGYRFMLWAEDDPDTFRIRIWTESEADGAETVIYDNGDGGTALGGGSIVIHTK